VEGIERSASYAAEPPGLRQPRDRRGIERQLGGVVKFDWQASGLHCTLSVPHDPNKESFRRTPIDLRQTDGAPAPNGVINPNDKRVLLVEDEPLVSMMLADMLAAFGHKVDGPYNRFSDAILAAKSNNLQAGILDVNLGGGKTYAVADILAGRKIPFAFVTGYGPTPSSRNSSRAGAAFIEAASSMRCADRPVGYTTPPELERRRRTRCLRAHNNQKKTP
jgi:CheY-like chemotaxis protein